MDTNQLPLLLSIEQVAIVTGFSKDTVKHWVYKDRPAPINFPVPVKPGGNVRFIKEEILAWIDTLKSARTSPVEFISAARKRGRPRKLLAGV